MTNSKPVDYYFVKMEQSLGMLSSSQDM